MSLFTRKRKKSTINGLSTELNQKVVDLSGCVIYVC